MDNIDAKTRELMGALSFGSPAAEQALSDWFHLFPESLYRVAAGSGSKAGFAVHRLLASHAEVCRHLCDPELLAEPAAKELARSLISVEQRLDIKLAQSAVEWCALPTADRKVLHRCLAILEALGSGSRITSALVQLLNCGTVRSKVVDLLVRWSTNEASVREWLRDPDPRVRANVLESLAEIGQGAKWVRDILLEKLNDSNGRAAANAAVGLYRMGANDAAVNKLSEMALSSDPALRCSAVWAMGQVPDSRLLEILNQLRTDPDARVRWLVLKSLSSFNRAGVKPQPVAPPSEPSKPLPVEVLPVEDLPPAPPLAPRTEEPSSAVFTTRTFGRLL